MMGFADQRVRHFDVWYETGYSHGSLTNGTGSFGDFLPGEHGLTLTRLFFSLSCTEAKQ